MVIASGRLAWSGLGIGEVAPRSLSLNSQILPPTKAMAQRVASYHLQRKLHSSQ